MPYLYLAWLIGLLVTPAPWLGADDVLGASEWSALEKRYLSSRGQSKWLDLISEVGRVDDERAARLLCGTLEEIERTLEPLSREYDRTVAALEPLQKPRHTPEEKKELDELNEARKDTGELISRQGQAAEVISGAMASFTRPAAQEVVLTEAIRSRSWRARAACLGAIGSWSSPPESAASTLSDAIRREKDARARIAALSSAGKLKAEGCVDAIASLLKDKFPEVVLQAAEALAEIGSEDGVKPLIEALEKQTGTEKVAISKALSKITGASLGEDAKTWRKWWSDRGKPAAAPPRPAPSQADGGISYYGIQTKSERVLFILDISDSMNDAAELDQLPEDGSLPNRQNNARSKIILAKEELVRAIVELSEASNFNIIFYNHTVVAWRPKMVPANKANKNALLKEILEVEASGATNIFEALEMGIEMAGAGVADRYYPAEVDTIFFLTDGQPTEGRIIDKEVILDEIARMNKFKKVKIHAIGMGILHDGNFLGRLAQESGGRYVTVK